jgi:hypothetical protein
MLDFEILAGKLTDSIASADGTSMVYLALRTFDSLEKATKERTISA